jgi:NAD-dependent dihydropyrimidine dehydrogenase PreA subunit
MNQKHRVLYCDCVEASALSLRTKEAVRRALGESGLKVESVPDLCGLAARRDPLLAELAQASHLAIAACHPRAVRWLFAAGGAPLQHERVVYLDMRDGSAEQHDHVIGELAVSAAGAGVMAGPPAPLPVPRGASLAADNRGAALAWKAWFPVVDLERCNACRQCVGFCLFGVYGVGPGGTVQVKNPARCKTGCPACARLCPAEAIIFPKYPSAPINGGEFRQGEQPQEPVRVDRVALLGSDPLGALRDRQKRDVLMSLPPDQLLAVRERFAHLARGQRETVQEAPGARPDSPNDQT